MFVIPSVTWWVGLVLADLAIMRIEYLNRVGDYGHFGAVLLDTWWLILIVQYGLFCGYKFAPTFMLAWGVYFAMSVLLRFFTSYAVGEPTTWATFIGTAIIVVGAAVIKLAK